MKNRKIFLFVLLIGIMMILGFERYFPKAAQGLSTALICGFPFFLAQAASIVGIWGIFDKQVIASPWIATFTAIVGGFLGFGPLATFIKSPGYALYLWGRDSGIWAISWLSILGVGLGALIIFMSRKGLFRRSN